MAKYRRKGRSKGEATWGGAMGSGTRGSKRCEHDLSLMESPASMRNAGMTSSAQSGSRVCQERRGAGVGPVTPVIGVPSG